MRNSTRQIGNVILVLAGLSQSATFSPALAAGQGCSAFKWPLTEEQGLFSAATTEARSGDRLPTPPDTALAVQLTKQVSYELAPERTPKEGMPYGAVVTFQNARSGAYQITLSHEAWIDVIQNKARVPSGDFTGAKGCPGLRKSVRFNLQEGPVTIQLSGSAVAQLRIAVRVLP